MKYQLFFIALIFLSCNLLSSKELEDIIDFPIPLKEGNTWVYETQVLLNSQLQYARLDTLVLGKKIDFNGKEAWGLNEDESGVSYIKWVFAAPDTLLQTERVFSAEIPNIELIIPNSTDTTRFSVYEGGDALTGINRHLMFEIPNPNNANRRFKRVSNLDSYNFNRHMQSFYEEGIGLFKAFQFSVYEGDTSRIETRLIEYSLN